MHPYRAPDVAALANEHLFQRRGTECSKLRTRVSAVGPDQAGLVRLRFESAPVGMRPGEWNALAAEVAGAFPAMTLVHAPTSSSTTRREDAAYIIFDPAKHVRLRSLSHTQWAFLGWNCVSLALAAWTYLG